MIHFISLKDILFLLH